MDKLNNFWPFLRTRFNMTEIKISVKNIFGNESLFCQGKAMDIYFQQLEFRNCNSYMTSKRKLVFMVMRKVGEKSPTLQSKKYTKNRIIWKSEQQPLMKFNRLLIDELSMPKTFPNILNPLSLWEKFGNEDKLAFLQLSLTDDYSLLEAETLQAAR